jgi:hypothetical protein
MGFSGIANGSAASALGTLRQFKLVDGLRGDLQISDLGERIIQPMSEAEKIQALEEAAFSPEVFAKLRDAFPAKVPQVNDPLKAILIRQEGFSSTGADEAIQSFRETLSFLDRSKGSSVIPEPPPPAEVGEYEGLSFHSLTATRPNIAENVSLADLQLFVPLGAGVKAEVRIFGEVTAREIDRLIQHLRLLKESLLD